MRESFNVDHVTTNEKSSHFQVVLYIFKDNEAVFKMIIEGTNPTVRHVFPNPQSCTWLVVWQNQFGPKIQIKNVDMKKTNSQTCWRKAISPLLIGIIFSVRLTSWVFRCSLAAILVQSLNPKTMSERQMQEEKPGEEERVVANSKQLMSSVSKIANQSWTALGSSASNSPGTLKAHSSKTDPLRKVWMKTQHRGLKCGIRMQTRSPARWDPWRKRQRNPLVQSYLTTIWKCPAKMLAIWRKSL